MAAGAPLRPNYTWCLLHVASIARHLGYPAFSALEFGCAGGNGLVALETAAARVTAELGVEIEIHGFDSGVGLPRPEDHRDAPYLMEEGHFPMDEAALRARLRSTTLHLGLVADTVGAFAAAATAPVGFVAQDLDFYSSTRDAYRLYDAPSERFLPRIMSYYDDTLGYPWGASNGERLATAEFNASHDTRVIDRLERMGDLLPVSQARARWAEALHLVHILDHPRYAEYEGTAISTRLDLQG
jgi:hypothetical protein